MNISEFRKKIKLDSKIVIGGKKFSIKEIIKFRLDDGSYYLKFLLSDGFVFADDLESNIYILVKKLKPTFKPPFPKKLDYRGKEYRFLYTAHAKAEEVQGEGLFEKGESERFWDYQAADGSYISLGTLDSTGERMDFYGRVIKPEQVKIA
jgi:hypothetical protein